MPSSDTGSPDDRLTPKQVAAMMGMSVRWIYKQIREGDDVPFFRRGSKIFFLRRDVIEWDKRKIIP